MTDTRQDPGAPIVVSAYDLTAALYELTELHFLRDRLGRLDDPRQFGKPLSGPERTLWRYRVGDRRIVADLRDRELIVLVVRLGHRSTIYRR